MSYLAEQNVIGSLLLDKTAWMRFTISFQPICSPRSYLGEYIWSSKEDTTTITM